jgi:hypothetical protein
MRIRGLAAAVAGVVGAATAHALDVRGLLPGVRETAHVRQAMGPAVTVLWLGLAGGVALIAARTRPLLVGAVGALAVGAVPELLGRLDPGAAFEPGAVAGALLQWLLLMAVVALAVVVEHRLGLMPFARTSLRTCWPPVPGYSSRGLPFVLIDRARPRAPPAVLSSVVASNKRGRTWPYFSTAASWRPLS